MTNKSVLIRNTLLVSALVMIPVIISYAAPTAAPPSLNVDANFNTVTTNSTSNNSIVNNGGLDQRGVVVNSGAGNGGAFAVRDTGGFYVIDENANSDALKLTSSGLEQSHYSGSFITPNPPVTVRDDQGFAVGNGSGTIGLNIAGNGDISTGSSADTKPVKVVDTYGLRMEGTSKGFEAVVNGTATAGTFTTNGNTGISSTASGASGIGGTFTGTSMGVWAEGTADTGVYASGVMKGISATASATNGTAGQFTANGTSAIGVYSQANSGTAGYFVRGANTVKLATDAAAVDATGVIKNEGLTIASNGDISDSSGYVFVNDLDGLQSNGRIRSTEGTYSASLWPDGGVEAQGRLNVESFIFNANSVNGQHEIAGGQDDVVINDRLYITPTTTINDPGQSNYIHGGGSGVLFNDANGVTINSTNSAKGLIVNNTWGGITVNANYGGMTINSSYGGMTINSSTGGMTLKSTSTSNNGMVTKNNVNTQTMYLNAQNGDAWFKGKVTSDTGFGTYTTNGTYSQSVTGGASTFLSASCPSGAYAVSCGYSFSYAYKLLPYYVYPSGSYCYYYFRNDSSTTTVNLYPRCLNPGY